MTEMNTCSASSDYPLTQNVVPIMHEIRHAMRKLLDKGEATIIDLRAMPFAPGEEDELETRLGTGEVTVRIEALGPSVIKETSYAGVWLVVHYNTEEEIMGKFIEITHVPSIIESQTEDIKSGIQTLQEGLTTDS